MTELVWIDGSLVPAGEAVIPATDHGLTVGDGLFETMKVVNSTAFALSRHLRRLRRTAEGLGLRGVPGDDELREAVQRTIVANRAFGPVGRVRLTVTGGVGPAGTTRGAARPTVLVMSAPQTPWPAEASVVTVPWPRNERGALAGLKTTSYAENVIALGYAQARGADEAIFANTVGNLCEGTGTNVFVVDGTGELVTPPLSAGCLAGITRELLLECTDVEIIERDLPIDALQSAPEAFLTSSTRDVQPISKVDDRLLARAPGIRTSECMAALKALEALTLDP